MLSASSSILSTVYDLNGCKLSVYGSIISIGIGVILTVSSSAGREEKEESPLSFPFAFIFVKSNAILFAPFYKFSRQLSVLSVARHNTF